jgi:sugar phosphate isomerase/epimerase
MGKWRIGASAKEHRRLSEYAARFDLLEVDMHKTDKLGVAPDVVFAQILPFARKVYSIHLRYRPTAEADGIGTSLADLEYLSRNEAARQLGIRVFVTHTDYPHSREELLQQLRRLATGAEEQNVTVVIENLADTLNRTHDFMDPRNPRLIAAALERLGSWHLGLCLDIGHAISNAGLTDSLRWDDNVLKWVKHVHFHDNSFRRDDHLPVSPTTSDRLIANFKGMLANSAHDGTVILEHKQLAEAVESIEFIHSERYKGIAPAMLG